jgi:signal transduction histidine kinase
MGLMKFAKKEQSKNVVNPDEYWDILIVDDEPNVHEITRLVLKNFIYNFKELRFTSAFSGEEALAELGNNPDKFAMVLLDVIMESDDAGLIVAQKIREELKNDEVRIILRTGQPGMVPEQEVVEKYDINDYKEKTDLTSVKLYTLMRTSLKAYEAVKLSKEYAQRLEERVAEEVAKNEEKEKMILAQAKQAAAGEVLSMIASQWREPLGTISASANNILVDLQLGEEITPEQLEEALDEIVNEMLSLSETIEQFQNYFSESQNENTFSLNLYIDDLCKFSESLLKMFKISLLKNLDNDMEVSFSKSAFSQVFVNLIKTAYDLFKRRKNEHTDLERSITIETIANDATVIIRLTDNAGGIDENLVKNIFDPNVTDKGALGPSGVALHLSKITVEEQLNGSLAIQNTQDGSTFMITLPLDHTDDMDEAMLNQILE